MNPHDKQNLDFLMNAPPDVLKNWWSQADADDLIYAGELLVQAQLDLNMKKLELCDDVDEDLSLAADVLKQFRK